MSTKSDVVLSEGNIVLAISVKANINLIIEKIKNRLSEYFTVNRENIIVSISDTTAIFFIKSLKDAYRIEWYYQSENQFSASAYPIIEEKVLKTKGKESLHAIMNLTKGDIPEIWRMSPPFCFFHQIKTEDKVEGFNDFLGFGRLYEYHDDEMSIISSSVIAIALCLPFEIELEENFWNSYVTFGAGLGDYTYFKKIRLVTPGHQVTISKGKIYSKNIIGFEKLIKLQRSKDFDAGDPIDVAVNNLKLVKPFMPEQINIGLSGGRDSRLIVALAIKAGLNFRTFTAVPPDLEAEVAEGLIKALPFKVEHQRTIARTSKPLKQPILDRANSWFNYLGGDCWSTYTRKDFNVPQKYTPTVPTLSGASGEVGRGVYYKKEDIGKDSSLRIQQMMFSALRQRMFVPQYMKQNAVQQYKASLFDALSDGIEGFHLLDYAFTINRVRRHFLEPFPESV